MFTVSRVLCFNIRFKTYLNNNRRRVLPERVFFFSDNARDVGYLENGFRYIQKGVHQIDFGRVFVHPLEFAWKQNVHHLFSRTIWQTHASNAYICKKSDDSKADDDERKRSLLRVTIMYVLAIGF